MMGLSRVRQRRNDKASRKCNPLMRFRRCRAERGRAASSMLSAPAHIATTSDITFAAGLAPPRCPSR